MMSSPVLNLIRLSAAAAILLLGSATCSDRCWADVESGPPESSLSIGTNSSAEGLTTREAGDGWKIEVLVTPKSPQLSDRVTMQVTVETDRQLVLSEPQYLEFPDTFRLTHSPTSLPEAQSKLAVNNGSTASSLPQNGQFYRLTYELSPVTTGELVLPRVVVPYSIAGSNDQDIGLIAAPEMTIPVTSEVRPDSVDLSTLDLKPVPMATSPASEAVYWTFIALLTLTLVVATAVLLRKYFGSRSKQKLSSEAIAEIRLAELEREKLPSLGKAKEYVTRLTDIVRSYIESKTGLSAPEQTTQEFIGLIRGDSRITNQIQGQLQEFLEAADLVKFAGKAASKEIVDRSYDMAKQLVQSQHWTGFQSEKREEQNHGTKPGVPQ